MKAKFKNFLTCIMLVPITATAFADVNEKGIEYYRAELYGAAKIFFLQQTGTSTQEQAENNYYLGQTYYKLGLKDSAQFYYDRSIETDAEYPFGYIGNGSLELEKGNLKQAEELFKQATAHAKKDPSVPTLVAEAYVEHGKYGEAAEALKKARKINNKYSGIYTTEGDMMMKQDKIGDAMQRYDNAILFNNQEKAAYLKCAQVYKDINPERSLEYLGDLFKIDPVYIPAFALLGDIYRVKGDAYKENNDTVNYEAAYTKALDAYEKFISIPGVPTIQHERYAQLLFFTKRYELAEKEIEAILNIDPKNTVMKRIQAYNNFALGKDDLALEQITNFLTITPIDKQLSVDHTAQGDIYLKKGLLKEAEASYNNALKIDESKKALLYVKLLQAAKDAKDYPAAIGFYEKYFEATPDYSTLDLFTYGQQCYSAAAAYTETEVIAAEKNDSSLATANETAFNTYIQKADKAFSDVISRKTDNYLGYFWKARLYTITDAFNKERGREFTGYAKKYYEEALPLLIENNTNGARKDDIVESYRYLGNYYYSIEKSTEKLGESYRKILEYDPDNAQAKKVLDGIKKHKAAQAAAAAKAAQGN
ncbi:MAG: hypothetical protein LBS54_03700 [Dysgonamonadaceae bacterium]|jgi:tetratricopeptide (TPR) repeat protein|nr:hypothetical protein [Dysgonamonadaceae bacterium]